MCTVSERDIYNQWPRDWKVLYIIKTEAGKFENLSIDAVKNLKMEVGLMEEVDRGQKRWGRRGQETFTDWENTLVLIDVSWCKLALI